MSGKAEVGCRLTGCLGILVFNLALGSFAFQYSLWSIFAKDVPWYADMIAGLFLGEFVVPLAVLCWIVRLCGVEVPFVTGGPR